MSAGRGLCRKALVAGSLLLLTVLNVGAQNKAAEVPQPAATFKSRTQLVLIPTIVTDHSGKPVAGLKAGDFSVLEDGRERQLAVAEEIHASSAPVAAPQVGKGMYANHGGPQQARNIVLMVLDTVNTPIGDQAYARQQMIKFLTKSVDRSALISLMMITQNGVKVIHNFTTDTSVLMAALRHLQSRQSAAEIIDAETQAAMDSADQAAVEQEENSLASLAQAPDLSIARLRRRIAIQTTLDSLRMIGQAYAGIPGRKALIWASAGFPFGLDSFETAFSGTFDPHSETASDMAELYRSTWRALNDANVALYPVDVRGLVSVSYDASLSAKRGQSLAQVMQQSNNAILRQSMKNNEHLATFRTFAERTGGRAFYNTNDIYGAVRQAAKDSEVSYTLGFYPDAASLD
jgi:VWFA-related protein